LALNNSAAGAGLGNVELRIPRRPEFVAVARLTVSGVASRLSFSYEDIEDIKIAVAEACTHAIQSKAVVTNEIRILCIFDDSHLAISIGSGRGAFKEGVKTGDVANARSLGIFLIESLMDDVSYAEMEDGTECIRMVKNLLR
jgi:serine/threonine-protein kinase RsbW